MTRSNGGAKPRVLLVDDHRQVLETVSRLLTGAFDVTSICDSRTALDTARQVAPDVIVLDVEMPELDGFQICRALKESGLSIPVVFLSMHDSDAHVSEALRSGGQGYVLKSRAYRDLARALDQALQGRCFVPSLTSLFRVTSGSGHAMQLHADEESFLDGLAAFFDLALRRGDASCVIATKTVRVGLGDRLRARGWDVGGASGNKRYLVIDATDALNRFMRNGLPDEDRLAQIVAELDEYRVAVSEGGAGSRLTVFGNMVVSLSADGNAAAVIALESLWNRLTSGRPFFTLCGYATSCFHNGVPHLWSEVCAEHSAVSHASSV